MANRPDELEFWLPSEFLTDHDILMDSNYRGSHSAGYPFLTPVSQRSGTFTTLSALSSPVESIVGSTETESDEDDSLLAELARQLTLLDGHRFNPTPPSHKKNWMQSGSPHSTLSHVGSWSGRSAGSSNESPNGPSQVSSPPTTPLSSNNNAWDLIYKAAGLVEGLKSNSAGGLASTTNSGVPQWQRSFSTHPPPKSNLHSYFYRNNLVRGEEFLEGEGCGMRSRQLRNGPSGCNLDHDIGRRVGSSDGLGAGHGEWSNVQFGVKNHQQVGSDSRGGWQLGVGYGVGHGYGCGSGSRVGIGGVMKSERVGTGVFLPRRYSGKSSTSSPCNSVASRKKSGYSSAHSAKKVPVTNKSLNNSRSGFAECQSQKFGVDTITDYDALLERRASVLTLQRTTNFPQGAINHELCLPQEWTY